jgi:NAD(P)-dependent dehydrogenase (short-subunit alcohol dehydrogenase family)
MGRLDGKTALVTGASTGIGLATARRFVAEGARVYVTGRREAELDAAAQALGPQAIPIRSDVSDPRDLDRLFEAVAAGGTGLDVLFANAGGGTLATIDELTPESYEQTFGINVKGTVFTVQKALPLLNPGATIIVTGSTSAHRGNPGFGVYSASKAALRQFVRVWAAELAPRGVRVNTLTPGPTDTPALRGLAPDEASASALLTQMAESTTQKRVASPDEIAAAALFLASADSSFVTGSELFADGGEVQTFS